VPPLSQVAKGVENTPTVTGVVVVAAAAAAAVTVVVTVLGYP